MSEKFKYIINPEPVIFVELDGSRGKRNDGKDAPPQGVFSWLLEYALNHPRMGTGVASLRMSDRIEEAFSVEPGKEVKLRYEDWETIRDIISEQPHPNMIRARQQRRFVEAWLAAADESRDKPKLESVPEKVEG